MAAQRLTAARTWRSCLATQPIQPLTAVLSRLSRQTRSKLLSFIVILHLFHLAVVVHAVDDHTRVKLSEPSGDPPSDYINASYLKVSM